MVSLTANNKIATQIRFEDLRQEPISNTNKVLKKSFDYGSELKRANFNTKITFSNLRIGVASLSFRNK
jgi:hypothetical protein